MADAWLETLQCAVRCQRCDRSLGPKDKRILSVYDHQPVCMACQQAEQQRPDYEEVSKQMIGQCMIDTELQWSDPGGYCFYHFYPFTC